MSKVKELNKIENELASLNIKMSSILHEKIYPLADALQLTIDVFSNGADFELKGSRNWVLPVVKNDFKFKTKIEASYVGDYDSAVLVHINKDFWIYAYFSNEIEKDGVITLYYLDFKGQPSKPIKNAIDNQELEVSLRVLRPLIRAKFIKGVKDVQWTQLPVKVVFKSSEVKK